MLASQTPTSSEIDFRSNKEGARAGGLASARNAGLAAATGEYVLPLDSDDRIDPTYIASAVAALEGNPDHGYVTCYVQNFGEQDNHYVPLGFVREILLMANPSGKCTSMFRKQIMLVLGGYDEKMISFVGFLSMI